MDLSFRFQGFYVLSFEFGACIVNLGLQFGDLEQVKYSGYWIWGLFSGFCVSIRRKSRFVNAVKNRSYAVCLVVEGLSDFGNVSAVFRSADALGIQSLHVVSCNSSKRYRENRHVSMWAEKWLDIELWDSTKECFEVLKSRGYRIATTHVGMDAVSVNDLDWTYPTAIVVGNEKRWDGESLRKHMGTLHCRGSKRLPQIRYLLAVDATFIGEMASVA